MVLRALNNLAQLSFSRLSPKMSMLIVANGSEDLSACHSDSKLMSTSPLYKDLQLR